MAGGNPVEINVRRKGSYGIDAPRLLPIPAVLLLFNLIDGITTRNPIPLVAAGVIALAKELDGG